MRLNRQTRAPVDKFEAEIYEEVVEGYLMAGDSDYLLRVVIRDLDEFRDCHMNSLARIPAVGNVKSHISMKPVKYSTARKLYDTEKIAIGIL